MQRRDDPSDSGGVSLPNYVDYVESLVGCELKPDNSAAIDAMSRSELADLREKNLHAGVDSFVDRVGIAPHRRDLLEVLTTWQGAPTPYERAPGERGEFRPLLHGLVHEAADVFGGDSSYVFRDGDSTARIGALKRYLLYAHRIVLPDPLFYVNQHLGSSSDGLREESRRSLIGFLDFLYPIRELVRGGIVSFYPQYEHGGIMGTHLFQDDGFESWIEADEDQTGDKVLLEAGQPLVSELLFFCERFGADCSFDRPDFESILAAMARYGGALSDRYAATARDRVLAKERAALETLGTVSLPGLDQLPIEEIVAVRTNAEGFDRWRDALGEGLLRIDEGSAAPETVKEAVAESLVRGSREVERDLKESELLAAAKGPARTLAIGAVAGFAAAGPPGALVGGGISAVLTTLAEYVGGRADRHAAKALAAHYSVWES